MSSCSSDGCFKQKASACPNNQCGDCCDGCPRHGNLGNSNTIEEMDEMKCCLKCERETEEICPLCDQPWCCKLETVCTVCTCLECEMLTETIDCCELCIINIRCANLPPCEPEVGANSSPTQFHNPPVEYDPPFPEHQDWDDGGGAFLDAEEAYDNFDWNMSD